MAIKKINVGENPNEGKGDPIRIGFQKVNSNFDELSTLVSEAAIATLPQALSGADDYKRMTPAKTKAVLDATIGSAGREPVEAFATAEQGSKATSAIQPSAGNFTARITVNNGTDLVKPVVDNNGLANMMGHFKIFPDLDGDGDYDADIWSKDNMYIVAEGAVHIRPNYPGGVGSDQGRVVFKAENGINYIQSGRNYSGTMFNDLTIARINSSFGWAVFDESQNGYLGLGFPINVDVLARIHAKDGAATIGLMESTSGPIARMAFKGTTTSAGTTVSVGANGDDLSLRGGGLDQVRINGTGMYPYADNARILGSASFRWSTVYAGTANINTSDARKKRWLGDIPEKVKRALRTVSGKIGHFQFLDAVAEKGDNARLHIGVLAQDVIEAFEREGLDPWAWAPICKDPVYTTVERTVQRTRTVTQLVERTRTVLKPKVKHETSTRTVVEIRDGVPILVQLTEQVTTTVCEDRALVDEAGIPVLINGEPILHPVPLMLEVAETYTEEIEVEETFDEVVTEQVETGDYILGLRAEELFWGLLSLT